MDRGDESGAEEDSDSSTDDEHTWTQEVKKKHRCACSKSYNCTVRRKKNVKCKSEDVIITSAIEVIKFSHLPGLCGAKSRDSLDYSLDGVNFLSVHLFVTETCSSHKDLQLFRELQREKIFKKRQEELEAKLQPKFLELEKVPTKRSAETLEEKIKRKFKNKSLGDRLAAEQERSVIENFSSAKLKLNWCTRFLSNPI